MLLTRVQAALDGGGASTALEGELRARLDATISPQPQGMCVTLRRAVSKTWPAPARLRKGRA